MSAAPYWSLAAVVLGALLWDFGRRWLKRHTQDFERIARAQDTLAAVVDAHKRELLERDRAWVTAFEGHVEHLDQRASRCEAHLRGNDATFNPLGKRYDPKLR